VLAPHNIALVQMVTPVTPSERLAKLATASQGFVYAVTSPAHRQGLGRGYITAYLERVRAAQPCQSRRFGIRSREQVTSAWPGRRVIVGSALWSAGARRVAKGVPGVAASAAAMKMIIDGRFCGPRAMRTAATWPV